MVSPKKKFSKQHLNCARLVCSILNQRYLDDRVRDIMRMRDVTIVMGLGFRV